MDWQSIETAPTDGKEFLAIWAKQGNVMQIVRFDRVHHRWLSKGAPIFGFAHNATHWMNLPTPPVTS